MSILGSAKRALKSAAPAYLLEAARDLKHYNQRHPGHEAYTSLVLGKKGLEIGGPTVRIFRHMIPIYQSAAALDGVNFSTNTIWEGDIGANAGRYAYYKDKVGRQFISEAADLSKIQDQSYDFLISSHCLEHVANPILAVKEWKRVVRRDGTMMLFLPNKAHSFDHRRAFTTFEHLLSDYEKGTPETDLTHLDEILEKHDYSMDVWAGGPEKFRARSLDNFTNRGLHHHVFDLDLLKTIFDFVGVETLRREEISDSFAIVGRV
jgi:ubiquinone/menaquinone biosynthesis C-methylase UbiE